MVIVNCQCLIVEIELPLCLFVDWFKDSLVCLETLVVLRSNSIFSSEEKISSCFWFFANLVNYFTTLTKQLTDLIILRCDRRVVLIYI